MTALGLVTCSRCNGDECRYCMWRGKCPPTPAYDEFFHAVAAITGTKLAHELFANVFDTNPNLHLAYEAERSIITRSAFVLRDGPEQGQVSAVRREEYPDGKPLFRVHVP